ncbi:MAG: cytochrome d ubiquinol oxidase subunit II [Desulfobacterales bacterium RIFOXYA12_FULL_46_15]|nr:MAG: cytochrome d ubiquinol oxidase subunit II [Desulfobacula sp. GWF2_41_7]OGR28573.1 MAG: cytochrome d ubiquinol oxidase subunit II [Desulfobacterales bacterium RIFOXYA12_FULL_46_15]
MELQSIWFFLWGLLWAVFFMTDGFDFGIGTLYPFLGKTDQDKRVMINSIGPLWDGNEVWLLTAGGVTFAAFPKVYAVMFSSLYTPLMLILFALIFRGVAFEFRGKINSGGWKKLWDTFIFLGSFLPALLFGVAFANIFQGIPFDGKGLYHGNTLKLLNPYGLLGGALFVLLFLQHGANWLNIKTTGELQQRAVAVSQKIWLVLVPVAVIFLIASYFATDLYVNYFKTPALFLVILITVIALFATRFFMARQQFFKAWFASALTIVGATFFGIIGLFPRLFPSSMDADFSLTAFNASSSPLTLKIMLGVVLVFIPLVIIYQAWSYHFFRHPVTQEELDMEDAY